jgi:hypothetical protein
VAPINFKFFIRFFRLQERQNYLLVMKTNNAKMSIVPKGASR